MNGNGPETAEYRIGWGSDMHLLCQGEGIMLGGVAIPCEWGCVADSDGDVLLHALVDALLGAGGLGDIGDHFPEARVKKGEASRVFVEEVLAMLLRKGGSIVNVDCVVDLERPKLGPHKAAIRDNVADLLGIARDRVNVKAKTGEGLGPVGTGQAVASQVTLLARLPGDAVRGAKL